MSLVLQNFCITTRVTRFFFKFQQSSDISVRLASPERLQAKPDVSALQFGKFFTDHMLKIEYHLSAGGWQQPCITPLEYLSLHPAAKVLHYATEVSSRVCVRYVARALDLQSHSSKNIILQFHKLLTFF